MPNQVRCHFPGKPDEQQLPEIELKKCRVRKQGDGVKEIDCQESLQGVKVLKGVRRRCQEMLRGAGVSIRGWKICYIVLS